MKTKSTEKTTQNDREIGELQKKLKIYAKDNNITLPSAIYVRVGSEDQLCLKTQKTTLE